MRVVLIDLNIPHYSVALANALASKVDLTFIEAEQQVGPWKSVIDPRMRFIIRKRPRNLNPFSFFRYSEWIQFVNDVKPDILHFQNSMNVWFDLAMSLRRVPPIVTTVHDATRHPGEPWRVSVAESLRDKVLRKSRGIIVHASAQRDLLCSKVSIPRSRVHVVPHAELGSLYRSVATNHVSATSRDSYRVLFFGRVFRYKGLGVLVEAMEMVRKKIPQAKLTIAGKGEAISQYVQSASSSEWIEVIEKFIPDSEISALFERSAIVVLPYLEASQSGVANVAMGLGTPVIASAIGGLKELIRDNVDGVLVPPGDPAALAQAIVSLMLDREKSRSLAEAALTRCKNDLAWDAAAAQTVKVYEQVLELAN